MGCLVYPVANTRRKPLAGYFTNLIIEKLELSPNLRQESCMTYVSPLVCWTFPHFSQTGPPHSWQKPMRRAPSDPQCEHILWNVEPGKDAIPTLSCSAAAEQELAATA